MSMVKQVYRCTDEFPRSERSGLQSQVRRAAVSVPSNIAEGHARSSRKEFLQFLSIALGSLAELETQLILARQLGWIEEENITMLFQKLDTIGKMLRGLQKSLHRSKPQPLAPSL
jgi:four helix bundle protein